MLAAMTHDTVGPDSANSRDRHGEIETLLVVRDEGKRMRCIGREGRRLGR